MGVLTHHTCMMTSHKSENGQERRRYDSTLFQTRLVWFCTILEKFKGSWIKKGLAWVGVNSLLIYCLHFAENNIYPISSVLRRIGMTEPVGVALGSWIIVVGICSIGAGLLSKLKIVRRIYG